MNIYNKKEHCQCAREILAKVSDKMYFGVLKMHAKIRPVHTPWRFSPSTGEDFIQLTNNVIWTND